MQIEGQAFRENIERFPDQHSKDIQQVLALAPYELASYLLIESRQLNGGSVPVILDALAAGCSMRAALTLCDLASLRLTSRSGYYENIDRDDLKKILQRCQSSQEIQARLLTIPTLDALRCRRELLNVQDHHQGDPTVSASYAVTSSHSSLPTFLQRELRFERNHGWNFDSLHVHYQRITRSSCEPVSTDPNLSERNSTILSQFTKEIALSLFPIERYGYGSLSETLECAPIDEETWGDRDVWGFINLWGQSPDYPSSRCFQCADTAPAARSFFVARGIPADVYVLSIGGVFHNVCIVFFTEHRAGRSCIVPVLVDASPYHGFYRIEPGHSCMSADVLNPVTCSGVYSQRAGPLAFVGGNRLKVNPAGLAPWGCEDLKSGRARVFTFGGVTAQQKQTSWIAERGTREYHGNGTRAPRPEVILYVAPQGGDPFEQLRAWRPFLSCGYHDKDGEAVLYYSDMRTSEEQEISTLRSELLRELQPIATHHLSRVTAMVRRCSYPLEEREFHRIKR